MKPWTNETWKEAYIEDIMESGHTLEEATRYYEAQARVGIDLTQGPIEFIDTMGLIEND